MVWFDTLDEMPRAGPLSPDFKALSDAEVERRAADRDAGLIPACFWDATQPTNPTKA